MTLATFAALRGVWVVRLAVAPVRAFERVAFTGADFLLDLFAGVVPRVALWAILGFDAGRARDVADATFVPPFLVFLAEMCTCGSPWWAWRTPVRWSAS